MAEPKQKYPHIPSSRRQFLKGAVGASAASLVLAACGARSTSGEDGAAPAGEAQAPAQTSTEVQQVRALMWSNGPVIDENFKKRADMFNKVNEGKIQVDLELLPYDQYWSKIDLAYAAKKPYDMYFWDVQAYGHYKAGLLLNLQPYVDATPALMDSSQYPTKLYDNWRLDGTHMYALPENLQTMALFYNKDLFDEAGLAYPDESWTWEKALESAKALTKTENEQTTQWGIGLGGMSVWWGAQTLSWGMGSAFVDKVVDPTKLQMNTPENIEALKFLQDLIWVDKVAPNAEQASAVAQGSGVFQTGKVAMLPDGSWQMSSFKDLGFNWDMVAMPKWGENRVPPFWFGGWVIPKDSAVPDSSFEFARWSATDYQETMATDHDWIPLQKTARESEAMKRGLPAGLQSVLTATDTAQLGDLYHRNGQKLLAEVFAPTFEQLWNNKITPEEAAKQIDEKGNELLQSA